MFKGSYRTTIGGALTATGTLLMGAGTMDWVSGTEKHAFMLIGFLMMAGGTFFIGLFARDNKVTSKEAGANKKTDVDAGDTVITGDK